MARNMVTKYGMSDEIGPVALVDQGGKIMLGGTDFSNKEYSERTAYWLIRKLIELFKKVWGERLRF